MDLQQAASCLEELGNPTRLEIFRLLVKAGKGGLPVGRIQAHLDVPASTLSHHIGRLARVGLLTQERQGRSLACLANYALMARLLGFLNEECCSSDRQATISRLVIGQERSLNEELKR